MWSQWTPIMNHSYNNHPLLLIIMVNKEKEKFAVK